MKNSGLGRYFCFKKFVLVMSDFASSGELLGKG